MKTTNKLVVLGATAVFTLSATAMAVADATNFTNATTPFFVDITDDTTVRYIIKYKNQQAELATDNPLSTAVDPVGVFSLQQAETLMRKHQAEPIMHLSSVNASVAELTPRQAKAISADPAVAYIEEDHKRFLMDLPGTMAQTTPYGIPMVQANLVSDANSGNTKVCVIDTGYLLGHPDLPNSGATGFSFSGHGTWNTDGNGHGTHVAGTMVALGNNTGVVGVLPSGQSGIHNVKIFNNSGNWTNASNLIQAIQSCKDAGAKVVNMSLGGGSSNITEQTAMTNFYNGGMLLIAAAGNGGNTSLSYPASYDAVVSVAAVDSNRNLASFSQRNAQVELAGPGVNVNSTWNNGGYNSISGTSMASPHVAGVAALVWSNHPQCTAAQIRNALNRTAQDRGAAGRDTSFGFGIVQAKAAHDSLTANGCSGSGGGGGTTPPTGGGTFPNLAGSAGQWVYGSYTIPAGVRSVTFRISGGTGDADLYVRQGAQPTTTQYNCRPYLNGNNEQCVISNPQAGTWHVGIRGYTAFSGVTMSYNF